MAMPPFPPQGTQVVCSVTIKVSHPPESIYSASCHFPKKLRNCYVTESSKGSMANMMLLEEVTERT